MSSILTGFARKFCKKSIPDVQPGHHVRVHQKIKEGNKERVQVFEGMVIRTNSGAGINSTFTVRKVSGGVGVEKVFPTHAPSVVKIEVLRAHKVRRAKLHFLRNLSGKALRLPEVELNLRTIEFEEEKVEKKEEIVAKKVAETKVEATEKKEEEVEEK